MAVPTLTIKQLANGQLPSSKGTLYTTPAATQTVVNAIILVNTDTVARTVNLYVKHTTSRRVIPLSAVLAAGAAGYLQSDRLTLGAGDLIEGDASVATIVDYVISGWESA